METGGSGASGAPVAKRSFARRSLSHLLYRPSAKLLARTGRLVCKNGDSNVTGKGLEEARRYFLADMYTSLVDLRWRYILLICSTAFFSSWLIFGFLWWLICYVHGDFAEGAAERRKSSKPCVLEVTGFSSALLYSIETQHTIGYGGRQLTDECPEAVLLLMIQAIFGMIMQSLMTGAMFAKLSRAKKRAETIMFSKNAVVCQRDGRLCLMFRIGDMRRSHLVGANVRAELIRSRISPEGEMLPLDGTTVSLGIDEGAERLMIMWPVTVVHTIDSRSPLWNTTSEDLKRTHFELIVILEGANQATGMIMQARTSYLAEEVLWGHRLARFDVSLKSDMSYVVDYSFFNMTVPYETPTCSARELSERLRRVSHSEARRSWKKRPTSDDDSS